MVPFAIVNLMCLTAGVCMKMICSLMSTAPISFVQWFIYSDQQKVELFLFGSSDLTNNENVEIFSHVPHFIRESNHFSSHYN